ERAFASPNGETWITVKDLIENGASLDASPATLVVVSRVAVTIRLNVGPAVTWRVVDADGGTVEGGVSASARQGSIGTHALGEGRRLTVHAQTEGSDEAEIATLDLDTLATGTALEIDVSEELEEPILAGDSQDEWPEPPPPERSDDELAELL